MRMLEILNVHGQLDSKVGGVCNLRVERYMNYKYDVRRVNEDECDEYSPSSDVCHDTVLGSLGKQLKSAALTCLAWAVKSRLL